jgi:hypothetical protein
LTGSLDDLTPGDGRPRQPPANFFPSAPTLV